MNENVFSRCTYEVFNKGMSSPEKCVYVLRCGYHGNPDEAMWAQVDHWESMCPEGYDWRVTNSVRGDSHVVKMVEHISPIGEVITKVFNFVADDRVYTMEYLLEHPELLPDGNIDEFKAAYAYYDKVKEAGYEF